MEKIDGDTLEMFAMANGLSIMPHRNANEWAEKINKNGGLCPCGKECPLSGAISAYSPPRGKEL